ncbi:MAG: HisA/HisF-related TIM barrel protein [Methanomassiliicoccales archaeon]|jgi:uncharacterized protein related to proFAR isomerase/DNA-directed RNA polymerase subunit RPC12/RpoP
MFEDPGRIRACPYCGSKDIAPKILFGGPLAGVDNKNGSYVCHNCGREAVPLDFASQEELRFFQKDVLGTREKVSQRRGFTHIPIVPVDTTSLFSIAGFDLPIGQVAEVVSVEWNGRTLSRTEYGAPFVKYLKAVEGKRYNATDILLIDLSGIQDGKPNFKVLRELIRRKYNVWLDLGMRSMQDLFDSFAMEISMAVASSLTVPSMKLLRDMFELSDKCLPCLFLDRDVVWSVQNGPKKFGDVVRELKGIGFDEVGVIDLTRLGKRSGISRDFVSRLSDCDLDVVVGGGVIESDLNKLQEAGFAGVFIDPYTPVIADIIDEREDELPTDHTVETTRKATTAKPAPTD